MRQAAVVLVVAVLGSAFARAQAVLSWTDAGGRVFGEPGVLVVVDSLEAQLATPGGTRTAALVLGAGGVNPDGLVAGSWSELSGALDAEPMEAIHRLFGSRVVVAFPGFGLPMPSDWVVATAVTRRDATRVLRGLDAVHRDVLAGATVFSIERGAYQLCVLKRADGGRLLVLGPGNGSALFATAVRGLQDGAGQAWFASDWPAADGEGAHGGVLVRVASETGPSLLYARPTETGWGGVAIAPARLPADIGTWSPEDARAMIEGASLGMVGSIDAGALSSSPLAPFIGLNRAAAESVLGAESRRGVIRIETRAGAEADLSMVLECQPGRSVEADALMQMLIGVVTGRRSEAPNFAGMHPAAARSARLTGRFSDQLGRLVLGERPRVSWRTDAADGGGVGLLAVSVGSDQGRAAAFDRSLGAMRSVRPGSLVSAGRLEPGPIAGIVERAAGLERPVLEWARGVESIAWQTTRAGEDRVKAAFDIVLRERE